MTAPRLSFHTERTNLDFDAKIAWLAAVQPRLVKVCEPDGAFCAEVKRVSPNTLILGRDLSDGGTVRDKWNRYRARSDYAYLDIIEGPNEWKPQLGIIGRDNAAYELELCRLAQANGKRYCALSWSEGEPAEWWNSPAQWDEFLRIWGPVLGAADFLGIHEYWWPDWDTPAMRGWHCFRWPKWYNRLPTTMRKSIIISEANWDGDIEGLRPGAGWRDILSPEQWADRLVAYERVCPPEIFAITLFNWGGWDSWQRFEIASGMDALRDKILEGGGQEMSTGTILPGMRDVVARLPRHPTKAIPRRAVTGILGFAIHHTGAVMGKDALRCAIQTANYHIRTNDWPGIAYGGVVSLGGESVQSLYLEEMGYQVREHNPYWFGILLDGNWVATDPTPQQLAELERIVRLRPDWQIKGHYELCPTLCPGKTWFERWRAGLAQPPQTDWQAEAERLRVENATLRAKQDYALNRARDIVEFLD